MSHAVQNADYDQWADQVVDNFIEKKSDLNSGILKVAQDNDLNPEQIKRLVEKSNTKTFLKLFKDENVKDKNIDFDVADAKSIIEKFMKEPHPNVVRITRISVRKVPENSMEVDFPDMMRQERCSAVPMLDIKTAHDTLAEKVASVDGSLSQKDKYRKILKMRKVAEELMNRVYESEHDFNEELDKVASEFCKLYGPDYETFEKDAVIRYGTDKFVKHALSEIRRCIKWDKPMYTASPGTLMGKVASLMTPEMESFKKMCDLKRIQVKYAEGVKIANRKLEELM